MSTHTAEIRWARKDACFIDSKYSRAHRWTFDGGAVVQASSSPQVVRVPLSDPSCVDPEEAFVAALASCHMLWFLDFAARHGFVVDSYADAALGQMGKNAEGKEVVISVTLRPHVLFSGDTAPSDSSLNQLHHEAHENCYLANSVLTKIHVEGSWSHIDVATEKRTP
jgi:organic hydroperoxide reductase OsmC/OhrA